ncbi:MAG: hypothetical protein D6711_10170 [Chloroflexi bacterium]|nr:MAG: hypothetical protein D6711_10170 [Chloroflexota bacterium]
MSKNKLFGPADVCLNNMTMWDKTILLTEVFAFLPSEWHGEYISSEELFAYAHPDLLSEKAREYVRSLGVIKITTPLLGMDFKNNMAHAEINGVRFTECKELVEKLYSTVTYVELLTMKFIMSKEQYFAHVFDNISDRTVATKYVFRKRVRIDVQQYLRALKEGLIRRAKWNAALDVDSEVIRDVSKLSQFAKELYI